MKNKEKLEIFRKLQLSKNELQSIKGGGNESQDIIIIEEDLMFY